VLENERTCDTFVRKTQQAPWVPFKHPREASTFTVLDKEEHQLFNDMSPAHSRDGRLDGPKGYKTFSMAWDLLVANRVRERHDGVTVQHANRKSVSQLQEHSDNLKKHKELLAEAMNNNDEQLQLVERVFKRTRRELQPHQARASSLTNVTYDAQLGRPQFGVPMALNTTIAAGAFQLSGNSMGLRALRSSPYQDLIRTKSCWVKR